MQTKCLFCDENYYKNSSMIHYLFKKDPLCQKCRNQLIYKPRIISIRDIKVQSFYEYNEFISSLILQFKECYDEALKDVFFYDLITNIKIKYIDYTIIWVPSTKSNKERRGFDHMQRMIECLKMKSLDALEMIEDISQNKQSKENRMKMIKNIRVKDNIKLPSKILLIDDVLTTGSSIYGAYSVIKDLCDDIKIISLAYVI